MLIDINVIYLVTLVALLIIALWLNGKANSTSSNIDTEKLDKKNDRFANLSEPYDSDNLSDYRYADGYFEMPFWNAQKGVTRNMSYDIRGDPIVIPKQWFPFNMATLQPIHNSRIDM